MKRYHDPRDQRIINRNFKERKRMLEIFSSHSQTPNKFDTQRGRYRKHDAYDCGKPGCFLCHGEKILGIKSHKQKKADVAFKDQLKDAS